MRLPQLNDINRSVNRHSSRITQANKMARVGWTILRNKITYQPNKNPFDRMLISQVC